MNTYIVDRISNFQETYVADKVTVYEGALILNLDGDLVVTLAAGEWRKIVPAS